MERLSEISGQIQDPARFRGAVISGRRKGHQPPCPRIDIRPVRIKDELKLQLVSHYEDRDLTSNIAFRDFNLEELMAQGFANLRVELEDEILQARITKKGELLIHRERQESSSSVTLEHDRKKSRVLPVEDPIFQALGISDKDGRLVPRKSDKFHQVDSFLRAIKSISNELNGSRAIKVVDLGCGSAYLTFAAQRFLTTINRDVEVVGVDVRTDSRIKNEKIAESLGINTKFVDSSISEFKIESADLVIALHACDTATDDALAWAVKSGAQAILAAPCCHHELNKEFRGPDAAWRQLLQDGIMKERFADLVTDSLRAQILRFVGYRTEIIEFISDEHTPRNLMIRAVKKGGPGKESDIEAFAEFCKQWQLKPRLIELLRPQLPERLLAALG